MKSTIVQFIVGLTQPDAVRLRAEYGLKLDRSIPNLGYLERISSETAGRLQSDFLVRACIQLDPDLKLSPSLGDLQATPDSTIELSATLFDDVDPSVVEAPLAAAGARDVQVVDDRPIGGSSHVRFMLDDLTHLGQIAAIDDLIWIEPVLPIVNTNVDAAETIQSGFWGSSPIWDQGLHGEGQVINVIDSGIPDMSHCFFLDASAIGPNHRKVLHIFNDTGSPVGPHITAVSGAAAGDVFGNSGAHQYRGGSWKAKLVCSNNMDLFKPKSRSMRTVLDRAKGKGAVIHANSWIWAPNAATPAGARISLYNDLARDVDAFSWANEDHLFVASGANTTGLGVNTPPGTAKNSLCVAAARAFPDEMSRGSGVDGPTPDGRRKPEIMAVGMDLHVAKPGTLCDFYVDSGTSFATPHVAAAAALVRQYFMEGFYPTGQREKANEFVPTGALLKAVLLNSTVDMTGEPGYPSNAEGWGLIRLNRVLFFDGGPRRLAVQDVRRFVGLDVGYALTSADRNRTSTFRVNDVAEQLKITLVWTDPPPNELLYNKPSQNVIKLTAAPNATGSTSYLGNDIDVNSGLSKPGGGGSLDVLNNVQMIIVDNPSIGPWTITLSTTSVWLEPPYLQGFALVVSGGLDLSPRL